MIPARIVREQSDALKVVLREPVPVRELVQEATVLSQLDVVG
jgi:hypothetical protein